MQMVYRQHFGVNKWLVINKLTMLTLSCGSTGLVARIRMSFAKSYSAEEGKGQFCSRLMLHVTLNAIVFKFSFLESEQHMVMNDDVD